MPSDLSEKDSLATARKFRLGPALLFLLFFLAIFTFPDYPKLGLDPSWKMALAWCFSKGMQFGRDVVFTYGPPGFLMAKTYFGLHFWSFIYWQVFLALAFSAVILYTARRLPPVARAVYLIFFLLLGIAVQDALQMIIIGLLAFELVRLADRPSRRIAALIALFLALLSLLKFTYFILATFGVLVACAYALSLKRGRDALRLAAWFFGGYVIIWVVCWQNPLNLPAYFYNSFQISQGYQEAMSVPTPPGQLWKAITALVLIGIYIVLYLVLEANKPRSLAFSAVLAAFIYLKWKHGFIRADSHMIGFFICASLPVVTFPSLLDEGERLRWLKRLLLVPAGVLCVWGIHDTNTAVVNHALERFGNKLWSNVYNTAHWSSYRRSFDRQLNQERIQFDLPHTRAAVGNRTVDVFNFEQAVALYNGLNYQPRPVFQSTSAYTPHLARLNYDYYLSDRAPDYVLLKIQAIDRHWPTLDDGPVLALLWHRYRYIQAEKGYYLWKRLATKPDMALLTPRPLLTSALPLNAELALGNLSEKRIWATIDIRPSFLGRLRGLFYKPAFVNLVIADTANRGSTFRLIPSQARTGFILNPVVEDTLDYLQAAANGSGRRLRSVRVQVSQADTHFFAATARVELFELSVPATHADYSTQLDKTQLNKRRFWMFSSYPIASRSAETPRETKVDGRSAIVMHEPSEMEFEVPAGTTYVSGSFGFAAEAYQNGRHTKGAQFSVIWINGHERIEIYKRFLNPFDVEADRGLQDLQADLRGLTGGRLLFQTNPGPSGDASWGWTVWTGIAITGPTIAPKSD